jgi:hypothetical protein
MKTILRFFEKFTDIGKTVLLLIPLMVTLVTIIGLTLRSCNQEQAYQDLEMKKDSIQNRLADQSQLRELMRDSLGTVSEKYSRISDDFNNFKAYTRRESGIKDSRILFLLQSKQEFLLENIRLKGLLEVDSEGNESALFDTTTTHYSLQAIAGFRPMVYLDIITLKIPDSTYVTAFETEDGFFKGQVGHSNPLIYDSGARFQIAKQVDSPKDQETFAWRFGLGYGNDGLSGYTGVKLFVSWGFGGIVSKYNRVVFLTKDF